MCGISGFNWKDDAKLQSMIEALSHRGPDAKGSFSSDKMSLGHNRLSIIDLSPAANQPMFDDANSLAIVFNGEIYNFRELKKELEEEYNFKTKSDTEVILAGYRKWGKGLLNKLNGMFAFAIWDKQSQELFCARDHAGIKPFYYFWDGKKFIFASEIKGILVHDVPRILNKDAFNHYLRVLYVSEPMTMIENINKLPPQSYLILKGNNLAIEKYGREEAIEVKRRSYGETKKLLRQEVIEAVERQLISDVPVGVYLSGGIDSSTVLFAMTHFKKDIETFSVGFELTLEEERDKFNNDFDIARKTANYFKSKHNEVLVSPKDALETLKEAVISSDDPISNPTAVAMMLLAKFAKRKVSVILTGSGGDELFGGYERYRIALAAKLYKKIPGIIRTVLNLYPSLKKLDYKDPIDLFAKVMFEKDDKLTKVISPKFFNDESFVKQYFKNRYLKGSGKDLADYFMKSDQESWLPDYFFMLSDKMSMRTALEERVPLADKKLWDFAATIPREFKVDIFNTKKILKEAFRNDLPDYLFKEPKRGWFSPGAKWFRHPAFTKFSKEVLSENYYDGTKDLFNWLEVNKMLDNHINKKEYNLTLLWAFLTFNIWARHYQIKL